MILHGNEKVLYEARHDNQFSNEKTLRCTGESLNHTGLGRTNQRDLFVVFSKIETHTHMHTHTFGCLHERHSKSEPMKLAAPALLFHGCVLFIVAIY